MNTSDPDRIADGVAPSIVHDSEGLISGTGWAEGAGFDYRDYTAESRYPLPLPLTMDAEKGRIPADVEMDLSEAAATQRPFPSKYRGVCFDCEERFPEGTLIRKKRGYGYVHDICPEVEAMDEAPGKKRQPFTATSVEDMGY